MPYVKMERRVAICQDQASLDRIASPDAALAIWWRRLSEPLRVALEPLDLNAVDDVSVDINPNMSIHAALSSAGYSNAILAALSADIDMLMQCYNALTGKDHLRVQLEVIKNNVCSSFRADYVTLRLLCTYVGLGTQWCLVEGQDAICEVPTGAVGVFKGLMMLNPPTILHRSPPPAIVSNWNLVLTIKSASDLAKSKIVFR